MGAALRAFWTILTRITPTKRGTSLTAGFMSNDKNLSGEELLKRLLKRKFHKPAIWFGGEAWKPWGGEWVCSLTLGSEISQVSAGNTPKEAFFGPKQLVAGMRISKRPGAPGIGAYERRASGT